MTTMSASPAPETRTKRSRIRRSFSLFSAPPIGTIQPRLWPSGTLLGIRSDDDDVGLPGARDAHEALEDPAVILLVLRTADRNDPTTPVAIGDFAGHPGLTPY